MRSPRKYVVDKEEKESPGTLQHLEVGEMRRNSKREVKRKKEEHARKLGEN